MATPQLCGRTEGTSHHADFDRKHLLSGVTVVVNEHKCLMQAVTTRISLRRACTRLAIERPGLRQHPELDEALCVGLQFEQRLFQFDNMTLCGSGRRLKG
jgi:hypothetical protein